MSDRRRRLRRPLLSRCYKGCSGSLNRYNGPTRARAKTQAQRRKQAAVGVFRCFSLSLKKINVMAKV
jgi:hypothetical protein